MTFIDALWFDTRHAVRTFRQTPGLTLTLILTIALVLTANVTIFSLVDAVVLRRVAVASPAELVAISATVAPTNTPGYFYQDTFEAFRAAQRSFLRMAMYNGGGALRVEPENGVAFDAGVEAVSFSYFDLVQIRAQAGRVLETQDDSGPATAVISERLAVRLFDAPSAAVGKTLAIGGRPVTVVGVTEAGFTGITFDGGADLFVSFATLKIVLSSATPGVRAPYLVGRLGSRTSLDQARAELAGRWPGIQAATIGSVPAGMRPVVGSQRVQLESLAHGFSGLRRQYGASLVVLMGLAMVLLAVGIVNIGGLLLARGLTRHHQFAVQRALGATRARLLQQSMLDGLLLAFAGLGLAMPLVWWLTGHVTPLVLARAMPLQQKLTPSPWAFAIAAAVTVVAGVLMGALPARRAITVPADDVLRGGRSIAKSMGWTGRSVLITQVALALMLVTGAGLFVATLANLYANDSGARTKPILWTRLWLKPGVSGAPTETYLRAVIDALSGIPGADGVALSFYYPAYLGFSGSLTGTTITRSHDDASAPAATGLTELVSPGFFDLYGISRIRGRDFTWADNASGAPVGIISQSLASHLFETADPIGHELNLASAGAASRVTIVGVVADAPIGRLDEPHVEVVFRPMSQELARALAPMAHVRVKGDLAAARGGYATAVDSQGRHFIRSLLTMDESVDNALLQQRLVAGVSTSAAMLALVLATIGIFGGLAYSVNARVREIGIRMSIGATRGSIVRMIVREGLLVVIAGIAIGVPFAAAGARLARAQLYGIAAGDPLTLAAVSILFVLAAGVAAWLPALRASRIQPYAALRQD